MGITTAGLSICASSLVGSALPTHVGIGIGSATFVSGNTALTSEFDRNFIDSSDLSVVEQVTLISNWSPNDISGCILREFGCFTLGSQMLNREVLTGSLVFDGEQELQIQQTVLFKI